MDLSNKALVCVEDDSEVLGALRIQLERNFRDELVLEFAQHVDEAIDLIDSLIGDGVDVILLLSDWFMPGKNADVLVTHIKKLNPDVRVIVLSGQLDHNRAGAMLEQKTIDKVIIKPWDELFLVENIRAYLNETSK